MCICVCAHARFMCVLACDDIKLYKMISCWTDLLHCLNTGYLGNCSVDQGSRRLTELYSVPTSDISNWSRHSSSRSVVLPLNLSELVNQAGTTNHSDAACEMKPISCPWPRPFLLKVRSVGQQCHHCWIAWGNAESESAFFLRILGWSVCTLRFEKLWLEKRFRWKLSCLPGESTLLGVRQMKMFNAKFNSCSRLVLMIHVSQC